MSYWTAGATIGSALIGSRSSSKAAKQQAAAAAAAAAKLDSAYQQGKTLQMPYYEAGTDALSQLMQRLPQLTQSYDPNKLTSEPGYEFGRQQGQQALEGSLAARGLTDSGAALKAAARYGNDYATTKLNDAFNRDRASRRDAFDMLTGTAGYGERAGTNMATQGIHTADSIAKLMTGGGDAQAANSASQGSIWGDAINQFGSLMKKPGGSANSPGGVNSMGFGTGLGFGNEDMGMYLADGGRVEPTPGTRAPRRAGGGGGAMSREAVLQALDAAWPQAAAPEPGTVAALPADPLRNPRAITEDRMRKAGVHDYSGGGAVRGKSGGKADKITAHLSGGEHVIDAEVVSMLGDGNSEAGHALLDELRERVREFKRGTPASRTAPALGKG